MRRCTQHAHTGTSCIFCTQFEEHAKEAAIAAAWSNTDKDWATKATTWIHARPDGYQFTADDLISDIGLPEWISTNAIGALFSKMAKQHVITAIGYTRATRMSSHGRVLRIWERT